MKKFLSAALLLAFVGIGTVSCKKKDPNPDPVPPPVEVKSLTLDKTTLALQVGATDKLTATVDPAGTTVTWASADAAVATVDNGTVTAVKEGKVIITATAGTKSAVCEVTVTKKGEPVDAYDKTRVFADIFFPKTTGLRDAKTAVFAACEALGWDKDAYSDDPNGQVAWLFVAPQGSESHTFGSVAYYHTPSQGDTFIHITGGYKPGAFAQIKKQLLDQYSFTTGYFETTLKGGQPAVLGWNEKIKMQGIIYMEEKTSPAGAAYELITFQVWDQDKASEPKQAQMQIRSILR